MRSWELRLKAMLQAETVKSLNGYCDANQYPRDRFAPQSFVLTTINPSVTATKKGIAAMKAAATAKKEEAIREEFLQAVQVSDLVRVGLNRLTGSGRDWQEYLDLQTIEGWKGRR